MTHRRLRTVHVVENIGQLPGLVGNGGRLAQTPPQPNDAGLIPGGRMRRGKGF